MIDHLFGGIFSVVHLKKFGSLRYTAQPAGHADNMDRLLYTLIFLAGNANTAGKAQPSIFGAKTD